MSSIFGKVCLNTDKKKLHIHYREYLMSSSSTGPHFKRANQTLAQALPQLKILWETTYLQTKCDCSKVTLECMTLTKNE